MTTPMTLTRPLAMLALALALLAPALAGAQSLRFDRGACAPDFCSESDWIFDNNATDHTTTWRHGLRTVPRQISILFTPDPSGRRVIPVIWPWHDAKSGNPVSIEMNQRVVRLHIHNRVPLHGFWDANDQSWTYYNEGYWKIIVYR